MSDGAAHGLRPLHGFERAFAAAGFPVSVVVGLGGAVLLMRAGASPVLALVVMITLHYTFLALMERRFPWHRSWLHDRGDLRTDIGLFAVNSLLGGVVAGIFLAGVAVLAGWLATHAGLGTWPTHWPVLAQLPLALVVAELVEYSVHRSMHEVPWLWRLHATHHSAPRLYWLNAVRFHPIDLFLVGAGKLVPLVLLGATEPLFAFVNLFSGIHGSYQHANVPVRIGPLNWIFSMTELHRWHHSPRMEQANHNYGGNLIVWDVVFGTRWLPADREAPEAIGIESQPNFPMGFWANLVAPFRWRRVLAESRSGSP